MKGEIAVLHLHGDLRGLVRRSNGNSAGFRRPADRRSTVKDSLESLGVPHTEVGSILVNGRPVDFSHIFSSGDVIEVHPVDTPLDITRPSLMRPHALLKHKFIADVNVGRLARLLRVLGFDTAYSNTWEDEYIAERSAAENRIVISKDRGLLMRSKVVYGRLVRCEEPWEQLKETVAFFGLAGAFLPFSRCIHCNGDLAPVEKEKILDKLEPLTIKYFDEFHQCSSCRHVYWPGSHHGMLMHRLRELGFVDGRDRGAP